MGGLLTLTGYTAFSIKPPWQPFWISFPLNNFWTPSPIPLKLTGCIWPIKGRVVFQTSCAAFSIWPPRQPSWISFLLNIFLMPSLIPMKLTEYVWPFKGRVAYKNQLCSFFNMAAILNFLSTQKPFECLHRFLWNWRVYLAYQGEGCFWKPASQLLQYGHHGSHMSSISTQ